jgi:molecular chaperone GrpE
MNLDDVTVPAAPSEPEREEEHAGSADESVEQQMLCGMDNILVEVAALHQMVKDRLAYDQVKEEAFDRLYAEVEEVRQDRAFQQLRPVLIDLILLYDRIEQGIQQIRELEASLPGVVQLLKSFRDEVLEILYRQDVEMIVVASPTFDRTLQQAIKIEPTALIDEHNHVACVIRRGFRYRNRILRPEEVIVKSYKAST